MSRSVHLIATRHAPRATRHAPRTTRHAPLQVAVLRAERIKDVRCNPTQWALYEAARVVRDPSYPLSDP